ncbi:MAG: PHP domain-containing protein, partial [bacterium]
MSETERIDVSLDRFRELLNNSSVQNSVSEFLNNLRDLELRVDVARRSWEFWLEAGSYESPPEDLADFLQEFFESKVDFLQAVRVTFLPHSEQSLEDWIQINWENLKQYLSDRTPAGGSMLEYAEPILNDGHLVVELADEEIKGMSHRRGLDEAIEDWIEERHGATLEVDFDVGDFTDSIEEDAEDFEEETRKEFREEQRRQAVRAEKENEKIIHGKIIKTDPVEIRNLPHEEKNSVTVQGQIIDQEFVQTSENKQNLIKGVISDRTDSISYKIFTEGKDEDLLGLEGEWVKLRGQLRRDTYSRARDLNIFAQDINRRSPMIRDDTAEDKRVELHAHTSMSQMDALFDVEELVERAAYWNHEAMAITDHGVVHSFPEAAHAAEEYGVKVIYGVEGYLVQDDRPLALNVSYVHPERNLSEEYVAVDCATTGPDPYEDRIFHLTAHRVIEGEVTETFDRVIDVGDVPESVMQHTAFTLDEIAEGDSQGEVLEAFKSFLGDSVLVAF